MVEKTFAQKILLSLDEIIPANVQAAILAQNPDTVEVLGQKVGVEYSVYTGGASQTFYAKARLTEALARQAMTVQNSIPTLPSGRQLTLVCEFAGQNFEASNIQELVQKIETHRIELAWATARQTYENSNYVSEAETVLEWLKKIYSSVEITKADNNSGEPILGWFSLESRYSGLYFSLRLRDSLVKSQEETKSGLTQLLEKSLAEVLKVPQAEPFQKESGWYGWQLTEVGQALQARFQQILETVAGEVTATNLQEKLETIKPLAEAAKADVGGNFSSCQTLIRETEEKAKVKIEEIAYGDDRHIVQGDLEQIPNLISQAKQSLQSLNYNQVREYCSKASELAESLTTKINQFKAEIVNRRQSAADRGEIWLDARVAVSTRSRCYTEVFCIATDGESVDGKKEMGEGRHPDILAYLFGDLSTDHLVISHGHDTYGYCYTEWWRVDYLPKTLTYAQRMKVEELGKNRQYFVGEGTGWNLRQVGKVEFTTAYSRDMTGQDLDAHNEQYNLFPINIAEYESWQNGHDPYLPPHMVGEPNPKVVVGPYKKKANQPPAKATPASGTWTAVDDPKMAKKGWYICPQGHTELIKNAEYGKQYTCGSCGHEYQII